MKEWCLKHPLLTFLIVDAALTTIQNCVTGTRRESRAEMALETTEEIVRRIKETKAEESKQPIGFAV